MRVLLTGGTGFLGSALVDALTARGDDVVVLSRHAGADRAGHTGSNPRVRFVEWTATEAPEPWWAEVATTDAIINLAGEPVLGRRWSPAQKAAVLDSRRSATGSVVNAIRAASTRPPVLVSASAIGYYGFHGAEELKEDAPPGSDFLATVCLQWEAAAREVESTGVRLVLPRIGVVLGRSGGALAQMVKPFRLFGGGPLGDGTQWVSWIHLADVVGLLLFALDRPGVQGPMNLTAPKPVTNAELSTLIGRALHRPSWIRAPAAALRIALGEAADVVLQGQRVVPAAALRWGYTFQHPDCEESLCSLLR